MLKRSLGGSAKRARAVGGTLALAFAAAAVALVVLARAAEPMLPLASDLAADCASAAASGRVVVLLYSTTGCIWCARVRREYLGPMMKNPEEMKRIIVREVSLDSDAPLIDPVGKATTQREFARASGVRFSPVTAFLGAKGREVAPRIVGFPAGDFYGAFLEDRIEKGREAARSN